jgi:large subunit ribosomal protein L30e
MTDINKDIVTTVKTGKVLFGTNTAINNAKMRKAKLIMIASNCLLKNREEIEYYCTLSKIPVIIYPGTSIDLGAICGKPFSVSALTIKEPGDSEILNLKGVKNG